MFFHWERCLLGIEIALVRESGACKVAVLGRLQDALIRGQRALVEVYDTASKLEGPAELQVLVPEHREDPVTVVLGWNAENRDSGVLEQMLSELIEYLVHAEKVMEARRVRVRVNLFDGARGRRIRNARSLRDAAREIVRNWTVFASYFIGVEIYDPATKEYVEQ